MILFLFLAAVSACARLAGDWTNELGSVASFRTSAKSGELAGTYTSAVGKASGAYALRGTYNTNSCEPTLAWSVTWTNSHEASNSSSSWSGVLLNNTIYATWLLTTHVDSAADVWTATRVGTNVFTRQK